MREGGTKRRNFVIEAVSCWLFLILTLTEKMVKKKGGQRELDVIIWGATGFTGRLAVEYIAKTYCASDVRWAIAGRNAMKLKKVMEEIATSDHLASGIKLIVASIDSYSDLEALAKRTTVVLSTVGPFHIYGKDLVKACTESGTHYVDITGEVNFVREMIHEHHEKAAATGTKLVSCCGWDSVPADLGAHMMVDAMERKYGKGSCGEVSLMVAKETKLEPSGGTLNTVFASFDLPREVLSASLDPCALNPEGVRPRLIRGDQMSPMWVEAAGAWTHPYPVAYCDVRVVRRSAALLGYGDGFMFNEGAESRSLLAAVLHTLGLGLLLLLLACPPTRWVLRQLAPSPGQGPARETLEKSFFEVKLFATPASTAPETAKVERGVIRGTRDPGYATTAAMVVEAALCLALQGEELKAAGYATGGVLTPASSMGMVLVRRLRDRAQLQFCVEGEEC